MTIEWFGATCVRLVTSEATVVIDPLSPTSGLKVPRLNADLILTTSKEPSPASVGGNPFIIDEPGEYEVKKIFIYGIPTVNGNEASVLYLLEAEGVSFGHLGNIGHQLTNGELERFEGVDVLFIPVGGHGVLDAKAAGIVISAIEPRIVIPMQHKLPGLKAQRDPIGAFAKELGVKDASALEKYKFSQKDLPQDKMEVVLLAP